ncbi:hypothetical protein SDJN03_19657, partial [Cucurbita argyrosperma subsp. sororia]
MCELIINFARVDRGSPGFVSSHGYWISRGTWIRLPGCERVSLEGWSYVSLGSVRRVSDDCWCMWASCRLTRGAPSSSLSS